MIDLRKNKTMKTRLDLTAIHAPKVFYGYIYPCFAKEFLFGSNYEQYATLINAQFILTHDQWERVITEWESKEMILSINSEVATT